MLYKKLKSATGILNRISRNIPKENYKSLYYSLFESHLNYCLTVYGTASKCHTEKLFRVQKHCIRILFGNREKYLDKFKTCARAREFDQQILGPDFHQKESTKPIFNDKKILAFQNIFNYQACLEVLKILIFRRPSLLYKTYTLSKRNNKTLLILPKKSNQFTYISSKLWNIVLKCLFNGSDLVNIRLGSFKAQVKKCLLKIQGMHDETEWYQSNFDLVTLFEASKL